MICVLTNKGEQFALINLDIYMTKCQVKGFHVIGEAPKEFQFLNEEGKVKEQCKKLSDILSKRINKSITFMSHEDILNNLNLSVFSFRPAEVNQYRFLLALLRGLKMDNDEISLQPMQVEYLQFPDKNPRYTKVCIWNPKEVEYEIEDNSLFL